MRDLIRYIDEAGFAHPEALIHVFIGGSELHGAKIAGTDDLDIYGVYIEPPALALGLDVLPHFVWSTAGDERRNGPNDIDITLYSLRKWAGLACKGNPTALHFLFAAGAVDTSVWRKVLANKNLFLARSCVPQFLGFAENQLKRITGELGRGKKGQRPELEARYGYDVKAGMHAIRLVCECKELVSKGQITLPRPERDFLVKIRGGELPIEELLSRAKGLVAECENAANDSPLPEAIDRGRVSALIADCYREYWDHQASVPHA